MDTPHVLIIGAGITGLVLAQALKKHDVSFSVFERDPGPDYRGKGWGLTLHWIVEDFLALLPQHVVDRLDEALVDPIATARGEVGTFPFFDLSTGEARWRVPPTRRLRLSRERLRKLLMDGIDIEWGRRLQSISTSPYSPMVTAQFKGLSSAEGTHLIGCDGARSAVRKLLCISRGNSAVDNRPLSVRFLGASTVYSSAQAAAFRERDLFFFQGGDPKTDSFHFFSFLDTPSNNDRENRDTFDCQVMVGWPYRAGFLGRSEPIEIPESNEERLQLMKLITQGWAPDFRNAVHGLPAGSVVKEIRIEDWPPQAGAWYNYGGRATLIGDAAHAMTMFRGEAANHGILDVKRWLEHMLPVLESKPVKSEDLKTACDGYEAEMISRTRPAVLASRRACLDAHCYGRINDASPLVSRRAAMT